MSKHEDMFYEGLAVDRFRRAWQDGRYLEVEDVLDALKNLYDATRDTNAPLALRQMDCPLQAQELEEALKRAKEVLDRG